MTEDEISQAVEEEINRVVEDGINQFFEDGSQVFEEAKGEIDGFFASLWGKICLLDDQCVEPLAHCDRRTGLIGVDGQCRPSTLFWSGIAISLLGACLCCLLCGLFRCISDSLMR